MAGHGPNKYSPVIKRGFKRQQATNTPVLQFPSDGMQLMCLLSLSFMCLRALTLVYFGKHLSAPSLSDVDCCSVAWEMPFDVACFLREAATHGENPTDNAKTYSKLSQFWNNHYGLKNKRVCPKISQNREFHDEH